MSEFTVTFNLRWLHPQTVWLPQIGGQCPIVFANADIVLIDRNVVATLSALLRRPEREELKGNSWWLSHLNHDRFTMNPVLYAFEGSDKRAPTSKSSVVILEQARNILREALPNARILEHKSAELDRVYAAAGDFARRRQAEEAFLLEVAPLLVERVRRADARAIENKLFTAARAAAVPSPSLALIAALSCLYETQDGSGPMIGRRVIKPKFGYTEDQAYNAVSDLQALLYLALASALRGECPKLS